MPRVKSINHVALVVANMEDALSFWRDALGMKLRHLGDVPSEMSQVAFLPVEGSEIELVLPTTTDSGIASYLAKRGPGMHHVCLEVDDLDGMLQQLRALDVRLISEQPRTSSDGKRYAFVHPQSTGGVLVELYETQ